MGEFPKRSDAAARIAELERELRALEDSRRVAGEKLAKTLRSSPDAFTLSSVQDGRFLEVNEGFTRLTGYTSEEALGHTSAELGLWVDPSDRVRYVEQVQRDGRVLGFETRFRNRSGEVFPAAVSGEILELEGGAYFLAVIRDITEQKHSEDERETSLHLLRALSQSNGEHELIQEVTRLMCEWSGCEAVGIRLQDGEDFPYYETRGFPPGFVAAENQLCATDAAGELRRDSVGNAVLECMCGNVIRGRFDPRFPFFTENGSFWTNSTTELLGATSEGDRQARTRNRCHGEGYESVALIPLRHGSETLGLLQFNDLRRGRFDLRRIQLLERLAASLAVGLAQRRAAEALRTSEAMLRRSQEIARVGSWELDLARNRLTWSDEVYRILGLSRGLTFATYESFLEAVHPEDRAAVDAAYTSSLRDGSDGYEIEHRVIRAGTGEVRYVHEKCGHLRDASGEVVRSIGMVQDISERIAGARALRESEERYRAVMMQSPDCLYLHDLSGRILDVNPSACATHGCSREALLGMKVSDLDPDYLDRAEQGSFFDGLEPGKVRELEARHRSMDGRVFPVEVRLSPVAIAGETLVLALARDLTQRKRAEEERERLEEQYRQSQKMEAIGRLAGGVAHDFNNLLCTVLGNAALALDDLPPEHPLRESLEEITTAANRGADLTRQLLAFSRKQVIEPKVISLSHLVDRMSPMLRRLLGEDILLETAAQGDLGRVRVDPVQAEQVVLNLAVNARDSMPDGGSLRIETADAELDADWCERHGSLAPGRHVMLAVSDTGCGMSAEVRERIFEPFFTTKAQGKGTGLGLATVFGIVRQHGGAIEVESEPAEGATFRVFFPRIAEKAESLERSPAPRLPRGSETVLLVEDESTVRNLAARVLSRQGYRVLTAGTGSEALGLAERYTEAIDLLLTDVVMPGMNGRELAAGLCARRKEKLRVLFTSGYTDDVIAHHGVLDEGVRFLAKPYTPESLALRVREVLDEALKCL